MTVHNSRTAKRIRDRVLQDVRLMLAAVPIGYQDDQGEWHDREPLAVWTEIYNKVAEMRLKEG